MSNGLMLAAAIALAAAGAAGAQPAPVGSAKPKPPAPAAEAKPAEAPPAEPKPADDARPAPDPQLQAISERFFASLQAGQVAKAYQDVWAGTQMLTSKPADVSMMATQTSSALQLYGKIYGWEPVKEDVVAPSFRIQTHMVRTELGPLFFRFQFYRRQDKWTVYRLDFADQMARLP